MPKVPTTKPSPKQEGRREQKRQETLQRITEIGLKLFIAHGYEGTTLDAIAKAANISRRTFFYYFKSKEDVLLAWHGSGFPQALYPAMLEESPDQKPLDAIRHCFLKLVPRYETKESIIVDKLLQSTESLRASKRAIYVEMEETLLKAMCELWPQPKRRSALRLVAMSAMGIIRLSIEAWRKDNGKRSLTKYLNESFDAFEEEIY